VWILEGVHKVQHVKWRWSYVEYWEDILLHLSKPLPCQSATLLEGFWPSNYWRSNYSKASLLTSIVNSNPEDPIQRPYCGPKNMRPLTTYTSFKNLNDGDFVLMRSHDLDLVLVWMGRAQGDVVKAKEIDFFKMVRVQWWVPMKKGVNLDEPSIWRLLEWQVQM